MTVSSPGRHRLAPKARRLARRYHFARHPADGWLLERGMLAAVLLGMAASGVTAWTNLLLARLAAAVTSGLAAVIQRHVDILWLLAAWVLAEAIAAAIVLGWLSSSAFRDLRPALPPDEQEPSSAWRNARIAAFLIVLSFTGAVAALTGTWLQLHP